MTGETTQARDGCKGYDPELPATKIIRKWGTNARFARAIGKTHTTTNRWLVNGHIPGEYHALVIGCATRDDIILRPEDFVDLRLFPARDAA